MLQCEPTLLPEPNHVMLNHLYALSIKDGVMVLSATHRYRKKYVTTLLYKPIWEVFHTSVYCQVQHSQSLATHCSNHVQITYSKKVFFYMKNTFYLYY